MQPLTATPAKATPRKKKQHGNAMNSIADKRRAIAVNSMEIGAKVLNGERLMRAIRITSGVKTELVVKAILDAAPWRL